MMLRMCTGHTRVWTERLWKSSFLSLWTQNTIPDILYSIQYMWVEHFIICYLKRLVIYLKRNWLLHFAMKIFIRTRRPLKNVHLKNAFLKYYTKI